ncbi:MAG: putative lipid II flippase FtsW [Myxococcales bacterium]|nr:putative lipid II flippase FtsW [Myxococcales bacterium]
MASESIDIGIKSAYRAELGSPDVAKVPRGPIDVPLLAVVLALTGFGLVMIYSASSVVAGSRFDNPNYFLHRQLTGVAAGVVGMCITMRIDYRWYRRLVYPLLIVSMLLMALVLVPGIGVKVGVARRWLQFAGMRFQPVELAKIAVCAYLAYSISKKDTTGMRSFTLAFIPHLAVVGAVVAMLVLQPDYGSAAIMMAILGVMLFVGGTRVGYLGAFLFSGIFLAWEAVKSSPYHMERVTVFLNPESHRADAGWQLTESFIALGSGGLNGLGLGRGHLKLGFVPELWNDFIATIIGHELGLWGLCSVAVLFLVFFWRGTRIAFFAKDRFGAYLAFGITTLIALQAGINLGVVTGLLPTKGLTLPFISYGRSSIVLCLCAVGILLNISQRNEDFWEETQELKEKERVRRELDMRRQRLAANREALKGKRL